MGLFLRQNDPRSELQTKVAAELQRKLRESSEDSGEPDSSTPLDPPEPAFLENQHTTSAHGAIITVMVLVLLGLVILFATKIIR